MAKLRLFLSLNPSAGIISELEKIQNRLKELYLEQKIRWEEPEKLHLTLRFLGDTDELNVTPLLDTLNRLKFDFEKIIFETERVGFFPNNRYPNVIYTGLIEKWNNSDKLVGFIDRIIYNFGVKPDKRFIPHITLGRFSRNKRIKITQARDISIEKFSIEFDSFCLMKSRLTPSGSVYETINKINFRK